MKTTTLTLATAALTAAATTLCATPAASDNPQSALRNPKSPNIVIILADDLGFADVAFNNCKDIRTPNLQRLADTGVHLTNFRACPICSPTRAGLMTGRWPLRAGLMKAVIPPWSDFGLPATEKILPQLLAPAGYEQRHMVGKWHLGHARRVYLPANRGFTSFYGCYNGALDYFTHRRSEGGNQTDWHRDTPAKATAVHEEGYTTDLIAADAVRFIREQANSTAPWLLYVAFNAPHTPFQAKPDDLAKYELIGANNAGTGKKGKKGKANASNNRKTYAAMVDSLDQNVGRIMAAVEKLPDADNTLILFFSDNGGDLPHADNTPWRAGKFSVYEGGIRVAAAIRWPAAGLSGGKRNDSLVGYIDIVPTLLAAAGLPHPAPGTPNALDGIDILPILQNRAPAPVRPWFSYIDQGSARGASVIEGDWKLVVHKGNVLAPGKTPETTYELYNITKDPTEKTDLAQAHPDKVARLKTLLTAFGKLEPKHTVGARSEGQKGFVAPKDWIVTRP